MRSFAILPAAGVSQRMGQPKLLLPWGATTVIEQVLSVWQASRVEQVLVVVRPDDDALANICQQAGALVVRPAFAPAEMKDSVRLGLERVAEQFSPQAGDVWLVAPCDLPSLLTSVIDQVLTAAELEPTEIRSIWVPACGEKRGHPVLFPWRLAAEVSSLGPHEGLNALVARNPLRTLELGPAAVAPDVDTPEEYQRLRPSREGPA